MPTLRSLNAMEVLDSRGRPTVAARCQLGSGAAGEASVPSGASTGTAEALELRDGDQQRYRGLGCRKAVQNVRGEMHAALSGKDFATQAEFDRALIELDGSPNKARLGANAILAASIAFARACGVERGVPLFAHFGELLDRDPDSLPRPTINLFSGGKHAGGQVCIQDVLVVPASARTMDEALSMTYAVYQAAADRIQRVYKERALGADEGGLAPRFPTVDAMLEDAVESIRAAGLQPGRDVSLAIDVASTHFYSGGVYEIDGARLDSAGMIERVAGWVERYPIVSVEDGLFEDDWAHWPALRARLEGKALVLGDDFLCTNPARIRRAQGEKACDALLLKVNQIGTLSEAAEACKLARAAGWKVTVSARSGETEDYWLADLAVGWGGDQIKIGSITRSERLAKYNRLLAIESGTGLPLNPWPGA
ncbi:MAG: enolase [Planctomycetota bacterium]|nr:enolase [Planctomycetota bacterium]